MRIMSNSAIVEEMLELSVEDATILEEGISVEELTGVDHDMPTSGGHLYVEEPAKSRQLRLATVNALSIAVHRPAPAKGFLEEKVPEVYERTDLDNLSTTADIDLGDLGKGTNHVRPAGLVKEFAKAMQLLTKDDVEEDYYKRHIYLPYRRLVRANAKKLHIWPLTAGWEEPVFVTRMGAVRVTCQETEEVKPERDINSAATW